MTFDALSPSLAQENLLTILLSTKWALIKTQLLQRLLIDAQFHEFLNYSKKLNLLKFMCSCVINSYFISLFTYSSFHSKKLHTPIHIHFLKSKNIFLNFNRANFVIKNIFYLHIENRSRSKICLLSRAVFFYPTNIFQWVSVLFLSCSILASDVHQPSNCLDRV